jgi:uncharacterized membrane protein YozB (DUF420 family)
MSANVADALRPSPPLAAPSSRRAHRWFFAGAALFLVVTVLLGFVPTSIERVAAVQAGLRPPIGFTLHAHALTMGAWLLLLLAQATLAASGRIELHRRLGVAAFVLAPLVVVAMTLQMRAGWVDLAALPPGVLDAETLATTKAFVANLLPEQLRAISLFALFVGWALAVRRSDPETHKRMMILATFMPLGAAIDRIATRWLPTTFPETYGVEHGYFLLWLAPLLIYDWLKLGRVHRAYVLGLAILAPFMLATHLLWDTPFWQALAPRLMGIDGW